MSPFGATAHYKKSLAAQAWRMQPGRENNPIKRERMRVKRTRLLRNTPPAEWMPTHYLARAASRSRFDCISSTVRPSI
jgi:hypothetical protein